MAPDEAGNIKRLIMELLLAGGTDYYWHQFYLGQAFSKDLGPTPMASRRRPKTSKLEPGWRKLVDAPS